MRLRDKKSGYDYIYTHLDDFKIVAKDPTIWVERIAAVFLIKEYGPRSYYLGNNYAYHDGQDMWTYGVQKYAKEVVSRVERIYGCLPKESTSMPVTECDPEMDYTPLLGLDDYRKFQMLLGMLQLMVAIGKPELFQVVCSLDRFRECPREGHLDLAVHYFGYVKITQDKKIVIDSRPMQLNCVSPKFRKLVYDFIKDYPDEKKEIDLTFPTLFGPLIQSIFLVCSDHTHGLKTRRSITGLIGYIGINPVIWYYKGQESITPST